MSGGGVQVVVQLLAVFPVVPLRTCQPKQPFLQDGVLAVPQGQRKAEATLTVSDTQETILSPAVGPRPSVIVREVLPAGRKDGGEVERDQSLLVLL